MKKFFTFIAMALVTMGASAQTTVWKYDYAKLATDHVTYEGKIDVARITGTKYKACGTDVYPFTCGEVVAASDVMISRGDGMLRYSDVRNLGLFNNNKNYYGIKNVKAGDVIEVAYNGGGNGDGTMKPVPALTDLDNVTVGAETSTFTHTFTYNEGTRTLDYTVYTLTVTADGIAGFALQAAYVGKITLKRTPATSGSLICDSKSANATIPTSGTDCKSVSFGSSETATFSITADEDAFRAANVSSANMDARGVNIDGTNHDPIYFLSVSGTSSHKFNITKSENVTKVTIYARKNDGDATKTVTIRKDNVEGDVILVANGFGGELASADVTDVTTLYVPAGSYIVFKVDYSIGTAIQAVKTQKINDGVMYNLAGQKVDASYKGVVIVNGKKVLNK